jgi:hypothetical protein
MVKTNMKQLLGEVFLTNSTGPEVHRRLRKNSAAIWLRAVLLLLTILLGAGAASAQLNIPVIRGDNGLKSGSQPGPGTYFTGIYYFYDADEVVDGNGTRFNRVSIEVEHADGGDYYSLKRSSSARTTRLRSSCRY